MLEAILLLVVGTLGAANLIIARKPNAKELIDKLLPYEGWIGASAGVIGVIRLVSCLFNIRLVGHAPLAWLLWLVTSVLLTALGLVLGVGVFKSLTKNEKAHASLDKTIARLAPFQGKLGVAAMALGALALLVRIFYRIG